jgi:ADP-heptose:LPS heptosyltransferase
VNVLIIKLGAAGDVVGTTTLLRRLPGQITWLTEAKNTGLLQGVHNHLKCIGWEQRYQAKDVLYDLALKSEDSYERIFSLTRWPLVLSALPDNIPRIPEERDRFVVEFLTAGDLV